MTPLTIAVIGGGSNYIPGIVYSMFRKGTVFADAKIRLYDVNLDNAQFVKSFCEKLARKHGFFMTFEIESELDRVLEGADFVYTTFRVGGVKALNMDTTIPPRFGYVGNETEGPGGLFMAMRTIPVIIDLAQRMERRCPGAWLINFANPANYLQDAVEQTSSTRILSLCNGYIGGPAHVAMGLALPADVGGIPLDPIESRHAGLNHFGWAYEVKLGDRDLLRELDDMDEAQFLRNIDNGNTVMYPQLKQGYRIFKRFGLYPAPLGHMIEEFFYEECLNRQLAKQSLIDPKSLQAVSDRLKKATADFDGLPREVEEVISVCNKTHANLVVDVIGAIAADTGQLLVVNVPNRGAFPGLTDETIVELVARVGKNRADPVKVPPFPKSLLAQLQHFAAFQQLVVKGILSRDTRQLIEAMSMHPRTRSIDQAEAVFKEMWRQEEAADVLGSFWKAGTKSLT